MSPVWWSQGPSTHPGEQTVPASQLTSLGVKRNGGNYHVQAQYNTMKSRHALLVSMQFTSFFMRAKLGWRVLAEHVGAVYTSTTDSYFCQSTTSDSVTPPTGSRFNWNAVGVAFYK